MPHLTGQAFHGVNIWRSGFWEWGRPQWNAPQYDLPDLPQYHLPELRGRRGKQRRKARKDKDDKLGGLGDLARENFVHAGVGGSVAEGLFSKGLCLPSGTAMTEEDLDRVISVILSCKR